jgi:membrane associated rhomboid family serine protease
MILPIGDQPNPVGFTPVVNYFLIAVNIAVFVLVTFPLNSQPADPADPMLQEYIRVVEQNLPSGVDIGQALRQVSAYDLFVFSYGYRPIEPSIVTLFTAMFLHGGFMHLFGNMLFLWIYGDNVEHRLGRIWYFVSYLATGVAATLFHTVFASGSPIPLVGASGAISGVLGFYFLWFPHNKIRLWVVFFPFFMRVFLAPSRWVLGFYIIISNILPFLATAGEGSGVAYGAHIGGFLAGASVAWVADRRGAAASPDEYRAKPHLAREPKSAGELIGGATARGDYDAAAKSYFEVPAERAKGLLSANESIALGNWLAKNGHSRAALIVYQRHLRDFARGPGTAEAHAYAGLIQLHAFKEPTAAYQHLVEALDYDPPVDLEVTIRKALAEISVIQKFRVPRYRH